MYSIGGRYGLPSVANYLREKKLLVGIGFEPDTEEAQLLEENNAFDRVLPYALGSENGIQKLNLTKNAACSSILIPHKDNLSFFCGDTESFEIQKKIDIEVYRLDEIIQKEELLAPDLLQIDTQGFEFEVLTGSTNILEYVSIVELEVHMYPLYVDEKMFADIHQFMTEKGFVLYRLEKSNAYGINYVEANACYYNKRIMNESRKSKFFIDYCNISYELV
jgi:FkbM family methyltransferase